MRFYRPDGTFQEDPQDVDFGWFFSDIAIDEATPTFEEHNEKIRDISRLRKPLSAIKTTSSSKSSECESFKSAEGSERASDIEESIDVLAEMESFPKETFVSNMMDESIDIEVNTEPPKIYKIEPNIKIETPTTSATYQLTVEGFIENPVSNFYKQIKNCGVPSKEKMMGLVNPVNPESKALLSVISYSKYRNLNEKETNDGVLRTINFKTTNSQRIIGENNSVSPFTNGRVNFGSPFRNVNGNFVRSSEGSLTFNFLLNDEKVDLDQQLFSEIRNYHATKEDNMLSLMMELIITDLDSSLGDMFELNNSVNELNNVGVTETSDLGNSIHSSLMSKEGNGSKEDNVERNMYLNLPSRSDILSSIGLTDEIDRSIEYFKKEKSEMHQQLCDIKKSFEEDEKKVDQLIDQAVALQNDLRETTYLDNLIHLLNGKPEKVKNNKLPFRIFHKSVDDDEADLNLII